jgi:hypothetical protein
LAPPGWADPETGRFDAPRLRGRDGKPYGPLPRKWARYRGLYHYGNQAILSYTVGTAEVLDTSASAVAADNKVVVTRTLNIGKSPRDLLLRAAPAGTAVAVVGAGVTLNARKAGMSITFSGMLDAKTAGDARNYSVKTWSLKRSEQYGSQHYNEKASRVKSVQVSGDGKQVTLEIDDLRPTWCMEIAYTIKGSRGEAVHGVIHNTVHRLGG